MITQVLFEINYVTKIHQTKEATISFIQLERIIRSNFLYMTLFTSMISDENRLLNNNKNLIVEMAQYSA
jgi:hypothetical protein